MDAIGDGRVSRSGLLLQESAGGEESDRRPAARRGHLMRGLVALGAVALAVLVFYVVRYPIWRFRVAIGSDTPVYVWWARRTGELGMRSLEAGGRPAVVGVIASLSEILRVPVGGIVAVIGPVLAASTGLAAGAFVDAALGRHDLRFTLATLFTGTYLSMLVSGYFSTVAFGALFIAALASLAWDPEGPGWGSVVAAGLLISAAGLAQPLFLVLAGGIVMGGLLALIPTLRSRSGGGSVAESPFWRTVFATVGGAAAAGIGILWTGPASRAPVDTSRDAILRRVHLPALSRDSYDKVLHRFFPLYRVITVLGMAALSILGLRAAGHPSVAPSAGPSRRGRPAPSWRLFWGTLAAWLLIALAGVIALLAGAVAPGQRMAAFCLALPILGAIGLLALRDRVQRSARSRLASPVLAAGVLLFGGVAWLFWGNQTPLATPAALRQLAAAGGLMAVQPAGTPLVLIVDDRTREPGFKVGRINNYLRDAVPPQRIQDVRIFVGTPQDFLAGRPTLTGNQEHDRIALDYWSKILTVMGRGPVAVSVRAVDPPGYAAAAALPEVLGDPRRFEVADGVLVLPGYTGAAAKPGAALVRAVPLGGVGPISPWLPVWLAPPVLALLGLAGWAWTRAALPRVPLLDRAALAPAFGIGAMGLASVLVDSFGARLAHGGGILALALAVAGGVVVAAVAARRRATPALRASSD